MENTTDQVSIFSLPAELLLLIFNKISLADITRTEATSKQWQKISWGSIRTFHANITSPPLFAKALAKMNPLYLQSIKVKAQDAQPTPDLRLFEKFTKLHKIQLNNFSTEDIDMIIPLITYIKHLDLMRIDDKQFELISSSLTNLTRLDLTVSSLEVMPGVTNLTRLNRLSLNFSNNLTDSAAQDIFMNLTNLTRLQLFRCDKISPECFQQVSQLKKLKYLDIGSPHCYDAKYFTCLQRLPNLEGLEFWFFGNLTDESFRVIGDIPTLTRLIFFVERGQVTPRGLENLSKLSQLLELTFDYERGAPLLNDHFISHLTNLTKLDGQIRKENITALTTLKNLREFRVETKGDIEEEFFMNLAKLTALSDLTLYSLIGYLGFTILTSLNHLTSLEVDTCDVQNDLVDKHYGYSQRLVDQLLTLKRLKRLHVAVDKCDNLSQLTNLEELSVTQFQASRTIEELAPLITLPKLRRFRADHHQITIKELDQMYRNIAPHLQFFEQ